MAMKHKLLDYLDVLHSEDARGALKALEAQIAANIQANGISTYFAHTISFYGDGTIEVGTYACGTSQDEVYVNKVDKVSITTKPKLKTLIVSKGTFTKLDPDLRTMIEQWGVLV